MTLFNWLFGIDEEEEVVGDPQPLTLPWVDFSASKGEVLEALGLRVTHIHPVPATTGLEWQFSPRTSTTVVYRPRQDVNHTIEISTAVCSANDTFSKKRGLELALERWTNGQRVNLPALNVPQSDVSLLKSYFG